MNYPLHLQEGNHDSQSFVISFVQNKQKCKSFPRGSNLLSMENLKLLSPVYTTIVLARHLFELAPVPKIFVPAPPFLSCKWKNSWHECPKTYGGRDYLSTWSRHSSVLGHSCHEFSHLHDKNEGCRAANFRHRGQI